MLRVTCRVVRVSCNVVHIANLQFNLKIAAFEPVKPATRNTENVTRNTIFSLLSHPDLQTIFPGPLDGTDLDLFNLLQRGDG